MASATLPIIVSSLNGGIHLGDLWSFWPALLLILTLAHVAISFPLHLITRKTPVDGSNLSFVPIANALQLVRLSRDRTDARDKEVVLVTSFCLGVLGLWWLGAAMGGPRNALVVLIIFPPLSLAALMLMSLVHLSLYGPLWLGVARRHRQPMRWGWASVIPLIGVGPQWLIALRTPRDPRRLEEASGVASSDPGGEPGRDSEG